MNNDLVSIVIPVYNVESYVERCLNSICEQTYKNIQIIVVNDGSTDRSGSICESFIQKDRRIEVYTKKNGGLSDARNYGIKKAKGKYICFIDSDDFIDSRMIEILYKDIITNNVDISSVSFEVFSDETKIENPEVVTTAEVYGADVAIKYLFMINKDGVPLKFANFAWNKMYLKSLFDDIEYPYGRKMEDLGTTYKLIQKAKKISFNPSKLYFYFQRDDSILHKPDYSFYVDRLELSYERYIQIHQIYPDCSENDTYMIRTLLRCVPSVYKKKDVLKYRKLNFSIKSVILLSKREILKYIIYKLNFGLYCRIANK